MSKEVLSYRDKCFLTELLNGHKNKYRVDWSNFEDAGLYDYDIQACLKKYKQYIKIEGEKGNQKYILKEKEVQYVKDLLKSTRGKEKPLNLKIDVILVAVIAILTITFIGFNINHLTGSVKVMDINKTGDYYKISTTQVESFRLHIDERNRERLMNLETAYANSSNYVVRLRNYRGINCSDLNETGRVKLIFVRRDRYVESVGILNCEDKQFIQ